MRIDALPTSTDQSSDAEETRWLQTILKRNILSFRFKDFSLKRLLTIYSKYYLGSTVSSFTHYCPAMPFGNRKNILQHLFSSVLSQFKKCHPSGNLKINYLVILGSLKLRILMEKFLLISLKLKFTPNTLGCYGLIYMGLKYSKPEFTLGREIFELSLVWFALYYI